MKTYAFHLKNIAALIMFCSLIALLFPFLEIATDSKNTQVSGYEIVKMGAEAGYEYVNQGALREDYVITGELTWGEVKNTITSILQIENVHRNPQFQKIMWILVLAILPVLLCIIAVLTTLFAGGKLSMILPTLCNMLVFIENVSIMILFHKVQDALFFGQSSEMIHVSLLIGFHLFTTLCGISLAILILLWISKGFCPPIQDNNKDKNNDISKSKRKSKDTLKRNSKDKKEKSKKTKKEKSSKKKKRRSKRGSQKKAKEERYTRERIKREEQEEESLINNKKPKTIGGPTGKIKGLSGMYQDIVIDITKSLDYQVILGTTPETAHFVENSKLEGHSLKIQYNMENQKYRIQSNSNHHILIKYKDGTQELLKNREIKIVDKKVILYVETVEHAIYLR